MIESVSVRYQELLQAYCENGSEQLLDKACDIGREAVDVGYPLARLFEEHLLVERSFASQMWARSSPELVLERTSDVLLQVLSAYELAVSAYRASVERMRSEIIERKMVEQDLRETSHALTREREMLAERVDQRTRELRERSDTLASVNAQLEARNQDLEDFAHITSHDLKEPLRGMYNLAQFILEDDGAFLPAASRERLGKIMRISRRMSERISALFAYATAGADTDEEIPVRLDTLLNDLQVHMQTSLQRCNAQLIVSAPMPTLRANPAALAALFENLISNGIKYNRDPTPRIEIACSESSDDPGGLEIRVTDNGVGMDDRVVATAFQMVRRGVHEREFGEGNGVGLALCQRIAIRLGGRIRVDSTPGVGTTFMVQMPSDRVIRRQVELDIRAVNRWVSVDDRTSESGRTADQA